MNKKPIILILASIYSFNSFAQASIQNVANGAAAVGGGYLAWKAVKNPLGTIALLALTGFAAYLIHQAGMKAIGWTKEKLIETFLDPTKHEEEFINLMYEHPMIFDKIHQSLLFASQKLKNKEALKVVNDFIDYHHLGEDKEFEQILQSTEYIEYVKKYSQEAVKIEKEGDYKNKCSVEDKNKLLLHPVRNPIAFYTSQIIYSIDRYGDLEKYTKNTSLEKDHIPSERSLIAHFGLNTVNYSLKYNGSSIAINKEDHIKGSRTHSYRNKRVSNTDPRSLYSIDAKNLLSATMKDLSFFNTYLLKNNLNNELYYQAGILLLKKNYELCLYTK